MSKVIDVFTFNGEYDLLEIRLNILDGVVDEFIIVEATETFSGKPKELLYEKEKERYKKWHHKIKYHIVTPPYKEEYVVLAHESPNTEYGKGAKHWITEFCQKESIKDALVHLDEDDIVFVGDVDEIWRPTEFRGSRLKRPAKLELLVYTYYLNNQSSEKFSGTLIASYKDIKKRCLNHLRTNSNYYEIVRGGGWHFTSLKDSLRQKLTDSYTEESYATKGVLDALEENVANNKDFLGRGFTYEINEKHWPQYLKDNKERYKHLCK